MLVFAFYAEEGEQHQKDKQVVHRQRLLYQVARNELHCLLVRIDRIEEINPQAEQKRHGYPHDGHPQRFAYIHLMLPFPAKHRQVDQQHYNYKDIEQNPCP